MRVAVVELQLWSPQSGGLVAWEKVASICMNFVTFHWTAQSAEKMH
jgi:hypothetical protein